MTEPLSKKAELLTPPSNFAVVQLPGRKYPGVVFQGDSLAIIAQDAATLAHLARGTPAEEDAEDLCDQLQSVLRSYLTVLEARSIDPPFSYRPPERPDT